MNKLASRATKEAVRICENGPQMGETDKKYRERCSKAFADAAMAWVGVDMRQSLKELAIANFWLDEDCDAPVQVGSEYIK